MTNGYNAFEKEETGNFKRSEKRGAMFSLLAGLILLLVIISVLAYRSGINIKQVRADIALFAASIKERYKAEGQNVSFTYGNVDGSGGLFHKTVTIANPMLSVEGAGNLYTLTTSNMILSPSDSDFHEFSAILASPLSFSRPNEKETVRYITPAPLKLEVTTNEAGMQEYLLPLQKTFSFEIEQGGITSNYTMNVAETSFIAGAFSPHKSKEYALSLSLDNAVITHNGANTAFSHAAYDYTASAEEGHQTEVSIEALTSDLIPVSLTPIALDVSEKRLMNNINHDVTFIIEKFLLTGNGFDLDLGGNVSLKNSELLPLVDVRVTANGITTVLNALQEKKYISADINQIIIGAFKRISPEWNEQSATALQFYVRRSATEPFMIGKMKADELLAIALKEWYIRASTAPAPATVENPSEPDLNGVPSVAPATEQENPDAAPDAAIEQQNVIDSVIPSEASTPADKENAAKAPVSKDENINKNNNDTPNAPVEMLDPATKTSPTIQKPSAAPIDNSDGDIQDED